MDVPHLFDLNTIPEIPLVREPRRARAARGIARDARFSNDYPADWHCCTTCRGLGYRWSRDGGKSFATLSSTLPPDQMPGYGVAEREGEWAKVVCADCLGMGSLKARVRLEAGHRCERCRHPYMPKDDAKMLGVEPTPFHWSPCDRRCTHGGPVRFLDGEVQHERIESSWIVEDKATRICAGIDLVPRSRDVQAEWRVLTVHHLDGDKANCRWWNLAALCQRCHLEIQAKVVIERVYPHEHSEWFKPYAAGWYGWAYLDEDLTREQVTARLDELLALELTPA